MLSDNTASVSGKKGGWVRQPQRMQMGGVICAGARRQGGSWPGARRQGSWPWKEIKRGGYSGMGGQVGSSSSSRDTPLL